MCADEDSGRCPEAGDFELGAAEGEIDFGGGENRAFGGNDAGDAVGLAGVHKDHTCFRRLRASC
jgi:hypothetical protein